MTFGLGHRFALANLAVGVALVASLVAVQTRAAKTAIRERARLGAEVALEQTATLCRSRLSAGDARGLFADLQPLVELQRFVFIDVFDPEGRPLVQLTNPERHRGYTQELSAASAQDDVLELSQPLSEGGRALGRLVIGLWVRGINEDLGRIERRGLAAGLGLCAGLALVSWLLGGRLSRRLRRLTDEIQRRGPDDFSPLEAGGADEVARLAAAFNRRQERLREERARRETAEAHRQDLVHMIVHDMKGPLSVFKSGIPVLEQRAGEAGDQRLSKMVAMLAEGSARLLRMAEGILSVARVEDPDGPLDLKPVDLSSLARQRVDAAAETGKAKRVSVALEAPPEPAVVRGDSDLLGRVLDNLLLNALEHTPKGGRVRVRLEPKAKAVRVEVRDTGPGVPKEDRARIFEKFRKGREASGGAGLGLAFCRLALQRHGGSIGVAEPPDGPGAVFHFELPL